MAFVPRRPQQKQESIYRTLYLSMELNKSVESIAQEYETSFNRVVVSMIKQCLEDE